MTVLTRALQRDALSQRWTTKTAECVCDSEESPGKAVVTWDDPIVTNGTFDYCEPASGSEFDLGETTVTCYAHDPYGVECNTSFKVTVEADTTAPEIDCDTDKEASASGECNASVEFSATATDDCSDEEDITIKSYLNYGTEDQEEITSPHSFPIGETTVTVEATDKCSNVATCTFNVTVKGQLTIKKVYDSTANGADDTDTPIVGWKFNISGGIGVVTTGAGGTVTEIDIPAGSYTVTDLLPDGNWVAETPTQNVTISSTEGQCAPTLTFRELLHGRKRRIDARILEQQERTGPDQRFGSVPSYVPEPKAVQWQAAQRHGVRSDRRFVLPVSDECEDLSGEECAE